MDDSKKRKVEETSDGQPFSPPSVEKMRLLLDPLRKDQLLDLLVKLSCVVRQPKQTDKSSHHEVPRSNAQILAETASRGSQYPAVAEEIKGVASADPVHRKLFVRGLGWDATSETLCAAFAVHGEIEEGAVIVDKATGKSRGFGFITYREMESTLRALKEPSKLINGRLAVCNLACEGLTNALVTTDQAQRKLYIGGLSPETSTEILLSFFRRHGEIEEGSVAYDKDTNKSRGFGFVTYRTLEAAKKAIDDPNKTLGGRNLVVRLAENQKPKMLQAQLPPALVPITIPVPAGYVQSGKAHVAGTVPISYPAYPQAIAAYPTAAYPSATPHYQPQPQMQHAQVAVKNDPTGLPAGAPMGLRYPYVYQGKN